MATPHQICPARWTRHATGVAIKCGKCNTRVVVTADGVPAHTIRCTATVYHNRWPDRCSRWAVASGLCKQHAPFPTEAQS